MSLLLIFGYNCIGFSLICHYIYLLWLVGDLQEKLRDVSQDLDP